MNSSFSRVIPAITAVALAACAPATSSAPLPAPAPSVTPAATIASLPRETHWARNSAEHRAIFLEVYRTAADRLPALAQGRAAGSWGVILDADETVIDNSDYQKSRAPYGGTFDQAEWTAWVARATAPALPGAVAFTARVHQLGGKVVIVTNRDDAQCPVTRENLNRVAITTDLVLCKTTTGDKNPRFQAVQNGTAAAGFPAIAVLEWVGDNIQDFPRLTQSVRSDSDSAYAPFGQTYFALPNAMYGSWESNPFQ